MRISAGARSGQGAKKAAPSPSYMDYDLTVFRNVHKMLELDYDFAGFREYLTFLKSRRKARLLRENA